MNFEMFLIKCTYLFNKIIPKKSNQLFFYSLPDYSDNVRAIYEEIKNNDFKNEYSYVWAVKDINKFKKLLPDVRVVRHRSINNLWHYCRSKYIFRTHSLWGNQYIRGVQKMCIAWHGMPLKREYDPKKTIEKVDCDILTSTADHFSVELSKAMGFERSKCKETGLPRNDALFKKSEIFKKLGYDSFNKVIIWMPTFRSGVSRNDGIESFIGLPTVPDGGLEIINDILKKKKFLLVLKLHPFAEDKIKDISFSNIYCLKNEDIPIESTLYEIVGQTDTLITDYSSIAIDYLLVDKPICFVIDDIDEYRRMRGFSIEPIEQYMAGKKIKSFNELLMWFQEFDGTDDYTVDRENTRRLFHKYNDNHSSIRVLLEMGIQLKSKGASCEE